MKNKNDKNINMRNNTINLLEKRFGSNITSFTIPIMNRSEGEELEN